MVRIASLIARCRKAHARPRGTRMRTREQQRGLAVASERESAPHSGRARNRAMKRKLFV